MGVVVQENSASKVKTFFLPASPPISGLGGTTHLPVKWGWAAVGAGLPWGAMV